MSDKPYLNILQITDIHFRKEKSGTIYGVATQPLFEDIISQIRSQCDEIDLILVTGDISQDGTEDSYRRFLPFVKAFGVPVYYLQGNHDYNQPMIATFGKDNVAPCQVNEKKVQAVGWDIIMLNSSVEDQVGGHFGKEQLDYLDKQLAQTEDRPILVCFHHHPMLINCKWLDQQVIDDADDFFAIIDRYSNVKVCIYGHIHQERRVDRQNVSYLASPSTCAQFKPEVEDFALDDEQPGYRWLKCYSDGSFKSEVVRLQV